MSMRIAVVIEELRRWVRRIGRYRASQISGVPLSTLVEVRTKGWNPKAATLIALDDAKRRLAQRPPSA